MKPEILSYGWDLPTLESRYDEGVYECILTVPTGEGTAEEVTAFVEYTPHIERDITECSVELKWARLGDWKWYEEGCPVMFASEIDAERLEQTRRDIESHLYTELAYALNDDAACDEPDNYNDRDFRADTGV